MAYRWSCFTTQARRRTIKVELTREQFEALILHIRRARTARDERARWSRSSAESQGRLKSRQRCPLLRNVHLHEREAHLAFLRVAKAHAVARHSGQQARGLALGRFEQTNPTQQPFLSHDLGVSWPYGQMTPPLPSRALPYFPNSSLPLFCALSVS